MMNDNEFDSAKLSDEELEQVNGGAGGKSVNMYICSNPKCGYSGILQTGIMDNKPKCRICKSNLTPRY